MLDILRSKSRSVLTYVLFGIIIVVFVVSFGPGSQGCQVEGLSSHTAVEVDGYVVAPADYEEAYGNLFRTYQARVGQSFTRELADQLGLRNVAMNQLVDRVLVVQEAKRRGLRVTPDEVNRVVWSIPSFQTDGRFDIELYRRAVRQSYGSESRFEERLVDDLLFQKMTALLREGALVSEDEVRAAWMADSDRVDLEWVRFPYAAARKEVKVTDAEVAALLRTDAAKVQKAYKDNAARFEKKKQIHARHILVKVPEGAPAAQDDAAKKKVEGLAERVKKEPFAQVAKETTDDTATREKGGDLGTFGPGLMAKPFDDAAFALKAGEVSAPVRTRFGWHLILVEGVEEARVVPLKEVETSLAREILELEGARKIADRRAREALAQARAGKKLGALFPAARPDARKAGPTLGGEPLVARDTGLFNPIGATVPGLGEAPALYAAAAAATAAGQTLPDVYATPAGPVVAQVKDRQRPDPAKYERQRDEIVARLTSRRQAEVETAWLKTLRDSATIKVNDALLRGAVAAQQQQ
jgi:peptidyl-prolyl cis-trans isomerase D